MGLSGFGRALVGATYPTLKAWSRLRLPTDRFPEKGYGHG